MDTGIKMKLQRWLRQSILVEDDERGKCKKLVIRHVAGGKLGSELFAIPVPKKDIDDNWFEEITNQIDMSIVDDAEGIGGTQSYVVLPFYENMVGKPGGRFTIREAATSIDDPDELDSEPPTKTGIISQMMRHTEAATRMSLMASGQIITTLKNTNARQAEMIEKLVAEKMANLETMERLKSEELERRLVIQREERSEAMRAAVLDKVSVLLPLVVNKLTGKQAVPTGGLSQTEAMVKGLVETIDMDQVEKLQTVLKPEQLVLLMEIFQNVSAKEEKPDALAATGGNGAIQPQ